MNRAFLIIVSLLITILGSCQIEPENRYLRWVGDIEYNDRVDVDSFSLCNGEDNAYQYFNLANGSVHIGEKPALSDKFKSAYKPVIGKNEHGLIRIRFIVNCQGKAGRFRVLQSDYSYNERQFDPVITSQLLEITKEIEHWEILYNNGVAADYYMYLIFKITDGQIIEILP